MTTAQPMEADPVNAWVSVRDNLAFFQCPVPFDQASTLVMAPSELLQARFDLGRHGLEKNRGGACTQPRCPHRRIHDHA